MARRERQRREQRANDLADDLLWGVGEIAAFIGRPVRQVYYLIDRGAIPVHRAGPRTILARKSELKAALSTITTESGDDDA